MRSRGKAKVCLKALSTHMTIKYEVYFIDPEKNILGGVGVGASFNAGDVHP